MSLIAAAIFNFAVVVLILWYFGRKPVGVFLVARSEAVAKAIVEAEQLSREMSASLEKWERDWKASEAHAKQHLEEARTAMLRHRESVLAAARADAERLRREGGMQGKSEIVKAKASLRRQLVDRSIKMAQTFLEGQLSEKDRQKLVGEYLERVASGTA